MYDTDDDVSISGKSSKHFGWDWPKKDSLGTEVDWQDDHFHETKDLFVWLDQATEDVVVQNNVQQDVAGEMMNRLKKKDQARGLESSKKRWSRMKSQRKADKDPLLSLEVVLFDNGLDVPTRQILDSRGAIPSKIAANAKVAFQQMAEYSQKWHNGRSRTRSTKTSDRGGYRATTLGFYQKNNENPSYQERRKSMKDTMSKFTSESVKKHEENSNLIKKIRASTDAAIRNQGASIKTLEIQIGKEKDPGSFTLPCFINNVCFNNAFVDLGASVSVMPLSTYLNLRLGELAHTKLIVELADMTMKYPKVIAENVLVGIGKFVFPVDFIILDMPEDIKVPLILERPFLSTAHAKIDIFKRKITLRVGEERIIFKSIKPASSLFKRVYMLSLRERMKLDLEARLTGETLVLNRSLDPFFEDYIELHDLNVPLELTRDQVDDLMPTIEEGEVVEEFRARNDARMVSNFFGYPSDCDYDKEIRIDCAYNLKFSCMIGNNVVGALMTYQMAPSHPRFKQHTNEQCNKIPPLLKDLTEIKEIDNVGGESTIWKS
nr:hypothetical protein [Tanacetum cinerariifolium]